MTDLRIAFDREKNRYLLHFGIDDKGLFIAPVYAVEWPTAEVAKIYYANASKHAKEINYHFYALTGRFDDEVTFFDPDFEQVALWKSKTERDGSALQYVASMGEDLTGRLMRPILLRGVLYETEIDALYEMLHPDFYYTNPLFSKDYEKCDIVI